jgi:hypothetical protein
LNHYKLNSNSQPRKIDPFGRPFVVHSVGTPSESDRNLMSIPLLWGSASSSANDCRRTFVVPSLISIWTWQGCLNYLQAHLQVQYFLFFFQSQLMVDVAQFQARSVLFFYTSDWISEPCRIIALIFQVSNHILNTLKASPCSWSTTRRPNRHLHFSTSGQISSLFLSISDEISQAELGRIAWILNSPSPSSSHAHLPRALHRRLVLVLLVSRPLIMVAASWVKLTRNSWIPQQVARSHAQACRQGCCQAAVNKLEAASALVWFGSMHGLVPDRWKANRLGRAGAQ